MPSSFIDSWGSPKNLCKQRNTEKLSIWTSAGLEGAIHVTGTAEIWIPNAGLKHTWFCKYWWQTETVPLLNTVVQVKKKKANLNLSQFSCDSFGDARLREECCYLSRMTKRSRSTCNCSASIQPWLFGSIWETTSTLDFDLSKKHETKRRTTYANNAMKV